MVGSVDFVPSLETDMYFKILMSLDDPSDLARASCVSRAWHDFAHFQLGHPIYSASHVRFRIGYSVGPVAMADVVADVSGQMHRGCADEKFVWTYTSPEFPMAQENRLQTFKLQEPVLCVSGFILVELLGRVQRQEMDGLFYICVAHVQVIGRCLSTSFGVEVLKPLWKLCAESSQLCQTETNRRKPAHDANRQSYKYIRETRGTFSICSEEMLSTLGMPAVKVRMSQTRNLYDRGVFGTFCVCLCLVGLEVSVLCLCNLLFFLVLKHLQSSIYNRIDSSRMPA